MLVFLRFALKARNTRSSISDTVSESYLFDSPGLVLGDGVGMRKIRVLVANQPRLMRELVMVTISDQPDLEIVGVLEDETAILGTVEQSRPDFLIITLNRSGDRPQICEVLLN